MPRFKILNPEIISWPEKALKCAINRGNVSPEAFSRLPKNQLNALSKDFYTALSPQYYVDDLVVPRHVISRGGQPVYTSARHALEAAKEMAGAIGVPLTHTEKMGAQLRYLMSNPSPIQALKQLVEFPCWPIMTRLVHQGKVPVYSNAFGAKAKGVYWQSPDGLQRGFTPLNPNFKDTSVILHNADGMVNYPVVPLKTFRI